MICSRCGANIDDSASFCTSCGAPMSAAQPVQDPNQGQWQQSGQYQSPNQGQWQQPQQAATYNAGFRTYFQAQQGRAVSPDEKKRVGLLSLITMAAYIALAGVGIMNVISVMSISSFFGNVLSLFANLTYAALGVLFWYFCKFLETKPHLTGIARIAIVSLLFISIIRTVASGFVNPATLVIDILILLVNIAFTVIYMLAITHKLGSDGTGRILTFVLAGVSGLCAVISLIAGISSYIRTIVYGGVFVFYGLTGVLVSLVSFAATVLMLFTMCMCVHYTSEGR